MRNVRFVYHLLSLEHYDQRKYYRVLDHLLSLPIFTLSLGPVLPEYFAFANRAIDSMKMMRAKCTDASTYLLMFLEELFEIDIVVFADQEHFAVEVRTLMLGVFAAYLVATDFAAAANPVAVASVQAGYESATSIAAVKPVAGTAATEMATILMDCVAIVAALKPSVVAASVQNDGLFGCLGCQTQFQTVVAVVTPVHCFPAVVDVYLLDCFDDSLTVVVAVAVAGS